MPSKRQQQTALVLEEYLWVVHTAVKIFPVEFRRDLVGEGYVKLCEARDKWDPDKGAKFSTYAYTAVKRGMVRYMRRECGHNAEEVLDPVAIERERVEPADPEAFKLADLLTLRSREQSAAVYGILAGRTMEQIGRQLGVSKQRVAQILRQVGRQSPQIYSEG